MAGANVSFGGKTPITDPTKVSQIFGQDNAGVTGPMALGVLKTALGGGSGGGTSALVLTSNPTVATDSSAGAVTGGLAIVKPTGRVFVCRDASSGAAVWEPFDASVGYKSGNYYGFDGAKVKGSSPDVAQPAVAGQHMLNSFG